MTSTTDADGRLYLPKSLRDRHGERFRIVDLSERIVLVPVEEEPLEAVRDAVGNAFEDESIEDAKRAIQEAAAGEIESEVAARHDSMEDAESGADRADTE